MVPALKASLRWLGTDHVDVYVVHSWDMPTPVEEVARGLDDMVRAGKVRYIGVSNTPAWGGRANTVAELRGWTSYVGLQIEYSLVGRSADAELCRWPRNSGSASWPGPIPRQRGRTGHRGGDQDRRGTGRPGAGRVGLVAAATTPCCPDPRGERSRSSGRTSAALSPCSVPSSRHASTRCAPYRSAIHITTWPARWRVRIAPVAWPRGSPADRRPVTRLLIVFPAPSNYVVAQQLHHKAEKG